MCTHRGPFARACIRATPDLSYAQIPSKKIALACQGGAVTLLDNPTFFQDHAAISMGQYLSIIAVDYKRSHTCFTNGFNDAPDFCDDERSQTFGGLVKNQDIGVGHQGPPDRQHLLLAAGKLLAPVPKTFGKPRKSFKYPFVGPVVA